MPEALFTHNIYVFDLPLLVVLISLVYSATRYDGWSDILLEAVRWGVRLVGFLAVITVELYLVNTYSLSVFLIANAVLAVCVLLYTVIGLQFRAGT
jgi:hypothetical protein